MTIDDGEDLVETLLTTMEQKSIKSGIVLFASGHLSSVRLQPSLEEQNFIDLTDVTIASLSGTIEDGFCRLYIFVTDSTGAQHEGYLRKGSIVKGVCELEITAL